MLAVAVKVEYRVAHSRSELAVSDTVQVLSGWFSRSPRGFAGIEAPVPAPGEDGGRARAGFPAAGRGGARGGGARPGGGGGGEGGAREQARQGQRGQGEPCPPVSMHNDICQSHSSPQEGHRPLPHSAATLALCVIKVLLIGVTSWRSDTSGPSPICSRPPATTPLGALLSGGWAGPTQRRPGYFLSAVVGRDGLRGGGRPAGGTVRTETGIEPASQPTARVLHGPFDEQVGERAHRYQDGYCPCSARLPRPQPGAIEGEQRQPDHSGKHRSQHARQAAHG